MQKHPHGHKLHNMLKKLKPYVIYSDNFLDAISIFMTVGGISLFPVVILREKYRDSTDKFWKKRAKEIINHETIHFQQQLELGVIPFYFIYVVEFLCKLHFYGAKAYENISFEREAYGNDKKLKYLETRVRFNWVHDIFK